MQTINWSDPSEVVDFLIRNALIEDEAENDLATASLGEFAQQKVICDVNTRESLVVAGLKLASRVFDFLGDSSKVKILVSDGNLVSEDTKIASIIGTVSSILRGERIFLNILGHLCGIATLTAEFVKECAGTDVEILDTRKTTPGMRALEKYAVKMGGGVNHRFSLGDMAMLKDNHLAAVGGVNNLPSILEKLRKAGVPTEVEVDNINQFKTVLAFKPDRILLDNMTVAELEKAVAIGKSSGIYLEASGGVCLETVRAIAETKVDGISIGRITHSVKSSDIGLDWNYGGDIQ